MSMPGPPQHGTTVVVTVDDGLLPDAVDEVATSLSGARVAGERPLVVVGRDAALLSARWRRALQKVDLEAPTLAVAPLLLVDGPRGRAIDVPELPLLDGLQGEGAHLVLMPRTREGEPLDLLAASLLLAELSDARAWVHLSPLPSGGALGAIDGASRLATLDAQEARGLVSEARVEPPEAAPALAAAAHYVEAGGRLVILTHPRRLTAALAGRDGTRVVPRAHDAAARQQLTLFPSDPSEESQ